MSSTRLRCIDTSCRVRVCLLEPVADLHAAADGKCDPGAVSSEVIRKEEGGVADFIDGPLRPIH